MPLSCARTGSLLVSALGGHASEAERLEIEAHLASCERCRGRHDALSVLKRLRRWEPPELPERVRDRIRRAALDSHAEPARAPSRRIWLGAALGGALTLAALALVLSRRAPASRILDGDVQASRSDGRAVLDGARLSSERGGRIVLAGPLVELGARTAATWREAAHTLELERGVVTVEVDPARHALFRVATPRFVVEVVGTRFTVDEAGVRTAHGKVRVLDPGGALLATVGAGEAWTLTPASPAQPPPAPAPEPTPAASAPPAAPARHASDDRARLAAAREAIARGRSSEARGLLAPLYAKPDRAAEARLLEAESFLVEKHYDDALDCYRRAARRFDATPAGESALYALGQLESERGHRDEAVRAFGRYLAHYPNGRFVTEARERIGRLTAAPR